MAQRKSLGADTLSRETFNLLCGVCKGEGINKEAEKFCVDCNSYYCSKCVKVHVHVPALSCHKILDKSHFPSVSVRKQSSTKAEYMAKFKAPTERCDCQSHNLIDMYCQDHDEVGCAHCFAVDHSICKGTFYIPEFLQYNSVVRTNDVRKKLESVTHSLISLDQSLKQEKQRCLEEKLELIEKLRKFRQEIDDILDKLEETTADNIDSKYKALDNEIEVRMKLLDSTKANLLSAHAKVATRDTNSSQDFVNAKKGNVILKNAMASLEKIESSFHLDDVDFIADQRITALLAEMNILGEIMDRCTESPGSTSDAQGYTCRMAITDHPRINTDRHHQQQQRCLQVIRRKYSVKLESDRYVCDIVSACVIDDGTIILSDQNNMRLKQFNSLTYAAIGYCDFNTKPWQICSMGANEVAVTLPNSKEVNFVTLTTGGMSVTNKMNTDFKCYGLARSDDNLYISDHNTSVYVYSMFGRKLKQFSKDQSGEALFSDIYSLAVSVDGSKLYVTDWDKGLVVLDNTGNVIERYDGPHLMGAAGSYLTRNGSLLVCGCVSENVLQFGENGKLIGEVVKNIRYSKSVCCDKHMSKMFISRQSGNEIRVYNIV